MEERVNYTYDVNKVIREIKRANKEAIKKHKNPFILEYKFYEKTVSFVCDFWQKIHVDYTFVKIDGKKPYGCFSSSNDNKDDFVFYEFYDTEIKFFHRLAKCIKK